MTTRSPAGGLGELGGVSKRTNTHWNGPECRQALTLDQLVVGGELVARLGRLDHLEFDAVPVRGNMKASELWVVC